MNYTDEALGIVRAACASDMPVAISFTLETDGRLPSGQTLADAIRRIDDETAAYPAYYMINCAHPTHFAHVIDGSADWAQRIRGLRANASTRSHAELDACVDLDAGDPRMLAMEYKALREALPTLTIVGGCCGTDERHLAQICSRLMGPPGANHSTFAPDAFTARAHLSRSVLRNDANSDALPPPKSIPMLS
jgi:S-methylmethionine-dependent homocysteine/selenocysteine methylase